ncbi:precorrin-6Y C5,15-methyltransferase (decarboxylating) subunit CbiT [Sulfurospirillum barnesii]|uniref:Precorrin-6Y C5,15-methyltransferase (Decarboxylating), CbiT subunit n=1 Tax=Sulfurospirillum barnesii (strain ATCC 700032 / DSM 10660 / SES-3) TaxID=760154 RepID=I3XZM8_SULBS|nr:precorrin-6Y C5,15-methyltransferase (decarboxylating) subunit CbiT [Sulfurospirillum barnesii]AFL69402.1 precorrin-6Y C5,15-methyltransferase (decarboxylating), CbiT subunit [Sulfurospirillum barnesii SES-3]
MVTIMGNGMGAYSFSHLNIDTTAYDTIVCDVRFEASGTNILKLPFSQAKDYILSHYEAENILYIVTGSPLFFSAGTLLAKALPPLHVKLVDNTSSKAYLLCALGIGEAEVESLSLHGREHLDLAAFLRKPYTFVLCDAFTCKRLKEALRFLDANDIHISIGYKLGYEDECICPLNLWENEEERFDLKAPYVLLIQRLFEPKNGLSNDESFATERGMITKYYKRHLSLQNLELCPNHLLWDVGAGSGSCGIEAYTRYKARVVFFEKNPERIAHITHNLRTHKVVDALLVEGEAHTKFESLKENPHRIFIGGGGMEVIATLPYLYTRLQKEGILLINAISLKHLSHMLNTLNDARIAYEVFSLSLTTYKGTLDLIEPQRQLFQIKVVKA